MSRGKETRLVPGESSNIGVSYEPTGRLSINSILRCVLSNERTVMTRSDTHFGPNLGLGEIT